MSSQIQRIRDFISHLPASDDSVTGTVILSCNPKNETGGLNAFGCTNGDSCNMVNVEECSNGLSCVSKNTLRCVNTRNCSDVVNATECLQVNPSCNVSPDPPTRLF